MYKRWTLYLWIWKTVKHLTRIRIFISFTLKFTSKLDLRLGEKVTALSNLSIYYTWTNIKSWYSNNKFKISAPTWNDEFKLPDGSYSVSDIQDYFKYILKKHGENTNKPSVQIYVNKIENRITFKIKDGYILELLTPETMKLLGSTRSSIINKIQEYYIRLFLINHLRAY